MKQYLFIATVFFAVITHCHCQDSGDVIHYSDLTKKIILLKRTSVSIEKYDSVKKINSLLGSGFLLEVKNQLYAITNLHVVEGAKNGVLAVGININGKKGYPTYDSIWVDRKLDIAIIRLTDRYQQNKSIKSQNLPSHLRIGISMIFKENRIVEGVQVFYIGYPMGLGKQDWGNSPISRIGIVAQTVDSTSHVFYVDGGINHGNSGSPIFDSKTGRLLGIVCGGPLDYPVDNYDNRIPNINFITGLITCVSAQYILSLIPKK